MTRSERLRRVVIVSSHFARNLAYYRAGWSEGRLTHAGNQFWTTVNGNCLDVCVLEWCKLLGDGNGPHHWRQIVGDPANFEAGLLRQLGMNADGFRKHIEEMRRYRDKFIAHLDSELVMNIPNLDIPKTAVWFYHQHVVSQEIGPDDLSGIDVDKWQSIANLDRYFEGRWNEAKQIYDST